MGGVETVLREFPSNWQAADSFWMAEGMEGSEKGKGRKRKIEGKKGKKRKRKREEEKKRGRVQGEEEYWGKKKAI